MNIHPMRDISLSLSFPSPGKEGKTRNLQKGLSIIENGQPLCAEGMGFGVPVIIIGPNTYASLDAEVRTVRRDGTEILEKTYLLNAVEGLEFRGRETKTRIPLLLCKTLINLYKKSRPMQMLLPLWSNCVRQFGFRTVWKKTKPVAEVAVKYSFSPGEVLIEVDLRAFSLVRNKARIYLLNEQGAEHFPKYCDNNGLSLERTKIGGALLYLSRGSDKSNV